MTHFSLKSTALAASLVALSLSTAALAAPVKAECTTNPLFAANACNVCYTETRTPTKTSTGWSTELSEVVIPWDHSGIDLQEVISENAQKLPEMIASQGVKVTPAEADKVWEFDTDIVWYEVGSDREFFIDKGDKIGLYTLKTGVKLAVSGTGNNDTLLIKTPLLYEEYNKELNQSDAGKSRNICVLNTFATTGAPASNPTPPPAVTPPTTDAPEVSLPALNAAGPEEEEEEVVPEITPEQTETKAGAEFWIFLLLAFVASSAWTAWKKQKI